MQKAKRATRQLRWFGDRVREYRLAAEMSQEALGEASGLHRTYIGHIERGEVNPTLVNVLKVAAAMGVEPEHLVRGLTRGVHDPRKL